MTTTQWIFVVFYAIFWGSTANVQGRWKMFHWPLIRYPHVIARLVLSNILLNVFPIAFFIFIFFILRKTPVKLASEWTLCKTIQQVGAGVFPAFAIFGFYRLWVAIVEFWPTLFYQKKDNLNEAIQKVEPNIEDLDIKTEYGFWNLVFAVLYLLIATGVPLMLIC
jgi:hypothetical protein